MSSVIDLLNETNNCEKWKVDGDTSKFFATVQALNYDKYLKYNHQLLIEKIFNGELVRCNKHDIPRLAKRHSVSEELIEKVLSIRSRNEYCVYQAYAGIMEDIYNVYINYIGGKDFIESIVKMLEDYRYKCNYFNYRILDSKLSISLFLDNYELLLLDSDSDYKCAEIEASSLELDPDVEEEVTVNAVVAFIDILRENGKVNQLLKEQAIIKMALYKDIIDCIDENYIKCKNDEDSRIVSLSRWYINKLKGR